MTTPQIVIMGLSFAGMLAFAAVAVWAWQRQQAGRRAAPPESKPTPEPAEGTASVPAGPDARPGLQRTVLATPATGTPERTAVMTRAGASEPEPTEFISPAELPGGREASEPEERTEFVAPPPGLGDDEPEPEPTEFVAPMFGGEPDAPAASTQEPEPEPEERTEFIPAFSPPTSVPGPPAAATPAAATPAAASPPAVAAPPKLASPPPAAPPKLASPPPAAPPSLADAGATRGPRAAAPPSPAPAEAAGGVAVEHHFDLAAEALAELSAACLGDEPGDAEGHRRVWLGHLEVLASIPGEELLSALRPRLADARPERERVAALRVLLAAKTWPARERLPALIAELEPETRSLAMRVLASADDAKAEAVVEAELARAGDPSARAPWLRVLAARGRAPEDRQLSELLNASEAELLALGLELLPLAEDPDRHADAIDGQLFAPDPKVRVQAITAGLTLANQTAWLVCKQLSRNPSFPEAAELLAGLGDTGEIEQLCAGLGDPSPDRVRALARSGRRPALERCVELLDHSEEAVREAARSGLLAATGADQDAELASWWTEHEPRFADDRRYLAGAPLEPGALAQTLRRAAPHTRTAWARELRVRSHGRLHLDPTALPEAWRRQLDALSEAELPLDAGFPWATPPTR